MARLPPRPLYRNLAYVARMTFDIPVAFTGLVVSHLPWRYMRPLAITTIVCVRHAKPAGVRRARARDRGSGGRFATGSEGPRPRSLLICSLCGARRAPRRRRLALALATRPGGHWTVAGVGAGARGAASAVRTAVCDHPSAVVTAAWFALLGN